MIDLPCDSELFPILKHVFPTTNSYETLGNKIVQASAEGERIKVDGDKEVFVKRVQAAKYSHKSFADLRRTLLYTRTEVRFCNEVLPMLEAKGVHGLAPRCHYATYNLNGLILDTDRATDVSHHEPDGDGGLEGRGGILVLDSMGSDYYQDSPLSPSQVKQCLAAVARLHAAAWEDQEVLVPADKRLSRGAYHLKMRNPTEIEGLVQGWKNFVINFRDQAPELFAKKSVQQLGQRVFDLADEISALVSPGPLDPFATLAHGDYKAMNVFIPKDETKDGVLIDFASTGVGLGMSDVAYHVFHALRPEDIDIDDLLDSYLTALNDARKEYNTDTRPYPREVAYRHFQLAVVDYFRFFLGRFWRSATVESLALKVDNKNTNLINREVPAAMAYVATVEKFVTEIEKELRCTSNSS